MSQEEFHSVSEVSYVDRESFNNAILLLTMVKSDYYYIVGFSRPNQCITIAFDFETRCFPKITEYLSLKFSNAREYIFIESSISNVVLADKDSLFFDAIDSEKFAIADNKVTYKNFCKKDTVFPMSINQINVFIKESIEDIKCFLIAYYNFAIKQD